MTPNTEARRPMTHTDRKAFLAQTTKRRDALATLDAEMDRALGRAIRWTNKVSQLRDKRKRLVRELAKSLAR